MTVNLTHYHNHNLEAMIARLTGRWTIRCRTFVGVSRVYRRQNAAGLVNTVKYTAVHNERTLFWCRYPRDDRVAFYSPFPSRPDVMGL